MHRYFLGGTLLAGMAALAWSCSDDGSGETLCDPGSNVFCRCRGTLEAGTKLCNDTGDGFGPCESTFGVCEEVIDDGTGGEGLEGSGGDDNPPDPGELYAPCDPDGDGPKEGTPCNEGLECAQGFCTMSCESYEDCNPDGDCIAFGSNNRCAPYCVEQADCDLYDDSVACGYTNDAVPTFDVVVCAQWGDELAYPPNGYPEGAPCDDDAICNLGFEGTERVCDATGCTDGCHVAADCMGEATCSSSGAEVGTCGGSTESVDACPGITVNLTTGTTTVTLNGDTSAAPPPSEETGEACTSPCLTGTTADCSLGSTNTEEDVYHLTFGTSGTLIINLEVDASYDSMLYVRDANCATGQQVRCEDAPMAGVGEITDTPIVVTELDDLYVFVDGFFGSTGTYSITFDLTPD